MRYAKLENGYPRFAPRLIHVDGVAIGNPTPEMLIGHGYKPVVYTDIPSETPAGYQWSEIWSEDDGNIQQGWVLVEVPITDEGALVRYANELTGEQDETLTEATETLIKHFKED